MRPRRLVEAANPKEFEYLEGSIPSEWDGNRESVMNLTVNKYYIFYDNVNLILKFIFIFYSVLTV